MIIGKLLFEEQIYLNELTPMDASLSVISSEEGSITEIAIQPDATSDFIVVDDQKRATFSYSTLGSKTISLRIKTDTTSAGVVIPFQATVIDVPTLFSKDSDLLGWEPSIHKYLGFGFSSYLRTHVQAQLMILDRLNQQGIKNAIGARLTYGDLFDVLEVKDWAVKQVLALIYEDLIVKSDDKFADAFKYYQELADYAASSPKIGIKQTDPTLATAYSLGSIGVSRA